MSVSKETVLEALRAVPGPNRTSDIVSMGLVSEIVVAGKDVMFAINVDPTRGGRARAAPQGGRTRRV
jgi:ATP-binding protein involved in chromosome partitioning